MRDLQSLSYFPIVIWREKHLFLETTYPYLSNEYIEYIPYQASFFGQLYIGYLNIKTRGKLYKKISKRNSVIQTLFSTEEKYMFTEILVFLKQTRKEKTLV